MSALINLVVLLAYLLVAGKLVFNKPLDLVDRLFAAFTMVTYSLVTYGSLSAWLL